VHPVKPAEIATAAVSLSLSQTETATTEDKAAAVGGLVSPIYESTRREK
jgi:hypothetical protein